MTLSEKKKLSDEVLSLIISKAIMCGIKMAFEKPHLAYKAMNDPESLDYAASVIVDEARTIYEAQKN